MGATVMLYEGTPTVPDGGRFWKNCQTHGVTVFYTAPTAIRAFMRWGDEHPAKHLIEDFGSDRMVFSTDYPHGDSRYPKATASFLELDLPDDDKRKILWDNCADFYAITEKVAS